MRRALIIIGLFFFVLPASAQTGERILRFESDVSISADGSMTVVETIEVNVLGRQLKRGIFRDFPTAPGLSSGFSGGSSGGGGGGGW